MLGVSDWKLKATWHCALIMGLFLSFSETSSAQSCKPRAFGTTGIVLRTLNYTVDTSETTSVKPGECDFWTLPQSTIDEEGSCVPQDNGLTYLLFEFWRLSAKDTVDSRSLEDIFFLVARGAQPNVTLAGNDLVYNPPLIQQPQLGQNGTMRDADADLYWRPYHRIVVPYNTSSYRVGTPNWFVTVANMAVSNILAYTVRVSCINGTTAPCPRPSPVDGECSGQGTCVDPPQAVPRPSLNRVCKCNDDLGDYGCQTPAKALGDGEVVSAVLKPGGWAFWQVKVPVPPSGVKPLLLVELSRSAVGFGPALGGFSNGDSSGGGSASRYGGDPVLVLMPKDADGSNRLPWFTDITAYADLRSYFLQQNLHYVLTRDLSPGLAAGGGSTAEYYVAVFNNDQRFSTSPQLLYPQANVTIRVRWRTTSGMGYSELPLCPNDCFGKGTCYDPWDSNTGSLPASVLPAVATNAAKPADFQCGCTGDYGGILCEGKLRNMTVSSSGESGKGTLTPGQWAFYVLNFDPRRFDYRQDVVAIQWAVNDGTTDSPVLYTNAYLTIDENAFPRNAQLDSDDPFRRGWQIAYNSLVLRSNPPQPLQMKGSDLKQGYSYVLGVYNSDYLRKVPFEFGLSVYVPTSTSTWLHPYMSVVLGVTASIILCLFMTLCRRLVQRYGWGPFRNRDPLVGGPNGNIARIQVAHMAPRQQGVPSHVIETFHTYQYTASKAEKVQLARSRRDHDAAQQELQRQASLQPQGSAQQPAVGAATGGAVEMTTPAAAGLSAGASAATITAAAAAAAPAPDAEHSAAGPVAAVGTPLGGASTSAAAAAGPAVGTGAGAAGRPPGAEDEDEPQCTVCLCEYEEGERITQLPCKHEFHSTCINKWLQTHYTCPICRVALLPDQPDAEHGGNAQAQPAPADPNQQQPGPAPVAQAPAGAFVVPVQPIPAFEAQADSAAPHAAAGAATTSSSQPGLMARMVSGIRRGTAQASSQVTDLQELPPQQQQQQGQEPPRQRVQRSSSARGVAEAVMQPEPAPASLVSTFGGDYNSLVATASPGGPQLLARGPSATLEARNASSGGGSAASRSPTSARLAAGRMVSPPRSPRPLGGSPGPSPNRVHPMPVPLLRDEPALQVRSEVDLPEPPGLSPSVAR